MWIRFKKRPALGYGKYHYFTDDGGYLSLCKREARRTDKQHGRGRLTCPDRSLVCVVCHEKVSNHG